MRKFLWILVVLGARLVAFVYGSDSAGRLDSVVASQGRLAGETPAVQGKALSQSATPQAIITVRDKKDGTIISHVLAYRFTKTHLLWQAPGEPLAIPPNKQLPGELQIFPPGKHRLVFYAEGYRLKEQEITVPEEGKSAVTVEMDPLPEPVKITFDSPADAQPVILRFRLHYDAYPFLGEKRIVAIERKQPTDSVPASVYRSSARLLSENGHGEFLAGIDAEQPFTICATDRADLFDNSKSFVSRSMPLIVYRHAKGEAAPTTIALKAPRQVVWRGKIDLAAHGADSAMVIWTQKLTGIDATPVAMVAITRNGDLAAPLEPGQAYERCLRFAYRKRWSFVLHSLPACVIPADAKELPEETLTPGPRDSGWATWSKIGEWEQEW